MMHAIVYNQPGDADVLKIEERPVPEYKNNEVLIEVKASGINKPDIFQRKGNYDAPEGVPSDIPGLEVSGVIVACGSEVVRWRPGDQVCALLAGGGYSNYVAVDERHCLLKSSSLTFIEAASLPETVFTVWHNVFQRGNLAPDESILIHGGSGGIGITGIQLAKLFGSKVFITAGTDEKCQKCIDLGADSAVNYNTEDFATVLKEKKIDVILDSIGGSYFAKNLELLNSDGRLIYINAMKGARVDLNLGMIMQRRISISGSTLRSRSGQFKANLAREVERNVWPKINNGMFKPVIYKSFSYRDVVAAHKLMESGEHFGKIIVEW